MPTPERAFRGRRRRKTMKLTAGEIDQIDFPVVPLSKGDDPQLRVGQLPIALQFTIALAQTADLSGVVVRVNVLALQIG